MHTGRADVLLRDVTIAQMGNRAWECEWHHVPEARGGFWGFWKSQSWVQFCLRRRRLAFACSPKPDFVAGAAHVGGRGRWKSQNRKNVYLSPYFEEPLNSKVIKSFVPKLRSRKCFSSFKIPMFYVYMLWTFYVRFTYPYHGYGTRPILHGPNIPVPKPDGNMEYSSNSEHSNMSVVAGNKTYKSEENDQLVPLTQAELNNLTQDLNLSK